MVCSARETLGYLPMSKDTLRGPQTTKAAYFKRTNESITRQLLLLHYNLHKIHIEVIQILSVKNIVLYVTSVFLVSVLLDYFEKINLYLFENLSYSLWVVFFYTLATFLFNSEKDEMKKN